MSDPGPVKLMGGVDPPPAPVVVTGTLGDREVDLLPKTLGQAVLQPELKPYSLPAERGRIWRGLLWLVAVLAVGAGASAVFSSPTQWGQVKDFLSLVFVPVLTLAGSAVGYYYGGRDRD